MNMGIDGNGWLQLSDGIIGAVIGAVALAVVSLIVAMITTRQQSKSTERQLAQQRLLSGRALTQQQSEFSGAMQVQRAALHEQFKEQRQALETELTAQREVLDVQLKEQRREAALAREIEARSDLIALLSEFGIGLEDNRDIDFDEIDRQIAIMIQRWRINLDSTEDREIRSALQAWCGLFSDTIPNVERDKMLSDGQFTIRRGMGALIETAINYRNPRGAEPWDSNYAAEYLNDAWQAMHEFNQGYYVGHKSNANYPTTPQARKLPPR